MEVTKIKIYFLQAEIQNQEIMADEKIILFSYNMVEHVLWWLEQQVKVIASSPFIISSSLCRKAKPSWHNHLLGSMF